MITFNKKNSQWKIKRQTRFEKWVNKSRISKISAASAATQIDEEWDSSDEWMNVCLFTPKPQNGLG